MKENHKNIRNTLIFVAGGVLAGFLYYRFIGCSTGSCSITSNPFKSMAYMGVMGWLFSMIFRKEDGKCNM